MKQNHHILAETGRKQKWKVSETPLSLTSEDIEPYVGPIGSIADMEGGIAITELCLNVMTGPSLVAGGRGLFLCIYDDNRDDSDEDEAIAEIIIPQGTPLCGYARGFFSDQQEGDKSVGFLFAKDSAEDTAVFYNQKLVTLADALWSVYEERGLQDSEEANDILFGHHIRFDTEKGQIDLQHDEEFLSRIFIPEIEGENQFSATSLGVYANDLAYDPASDKDHYLDQSEKNNVLALVWRLAIDDKTGMLVPSWPVVIARKDVRLLNTVPMEVGLQYGYSYWDAVAKEGTSKYISD